MAHALGVSRPCILEVHDCMKSNIIKKNEKNAKKDTKYHRLLYQKLQTYIIYLYIYIYISTCDYVAYNLVD